MGRDAVAFGGMCTNAVTMESYRDRLRIDLGTGGASWRGWMFSPWGRSGECWLLDPNGTRYCASEIAELRRMALDLDYLQTRVKQLEALVRAPRLTTQQRRTVIDAMQILTAAGAAEATDAALYAIIGRESVPF